MTDEHRQFVDAVMAIVTADDGAVAQNNIQRYFHPTEPFTGSKFEVLADRDRTNRITAADIVAVSTLSVNIPAEVAVWLLSEAGQLRVSSLLANVPANTDLWDRPELLAPDGDLWRLWSLLGTACWPEPAKGNGMGTTKISKLLATKRPRLVPIFDRIVRDALPPVRSHWAAFTEVLADPERRTEISRVTAAAPDHISLLRRLDIVLWMAHS
ncbi:DUF6308 family protein [Actinomarinicola tropica]|uniref:Uncharacterized protein n=1 Tax=Actinomarinicola tropica TaxID=2789776 RepID=A0A5Q2RIH8_9ACTN|nr:DUF6308 family protein [Actinomarinicola tropica]QGG94381.1 hypothetical protein GH723_04275 [Actinomarinicola tropica]